MSFSKLLVAALLSTLTLVPAAASAAGKEFRSANEAARTAAANKFNADKTTRKTINAGKALTPGQAQVYSYFTKNGISTNIVATRAAMRDHNGEIITTRSGKSLVRLTAVRLQGRT